MSDSVRSFQDLYYLAESFKVGSQGSREGFMYTSFTWFDNDDHAYFGLITTPKLELNIEQVSKALKQIPDEDIYPLLTDASTPLSVAPDHYNQVTAANLQGVYIKRPQIKDFEWYKEEDLVEMIPATLLEEASALQRISQHPQHPNIVKFLGCRTRRGRVTGLMMERYEFTLTDFVNEGHTMDKKRFLDCLESAIRHLHGLHLAHNDINPANIMVNTDTKEPVLVDFGSCHIIGDKLTASRGTPGWIEEGDDYSISKASHDTSALTKIRTWLCGVSK
jgi:serine/threonine protein kinase